MDIEPRPSHPNRKEDPDYSKTFSVVGQTGLRRLDGWEKVSGRAMFARDFVFPGTLFARILRCPYAHATIKSMDTSKAAAYPGVRKIVRYDDNFATQTGSVGAGISSQFTIDPTLLLGMVVPQTGFFEGDPIGVAVIADTDEIAQEALRLVTLEWTVLPFVLECADALKDGAPLCVNPRSLNSGSDPKSNRNVGPSGVQILTGGNVQGDVQQGFAQAAHTVTFTTYKAENHARVEPMSGSFVFKDNHIEYAAPGQFQPGTFAAAATGAVNTYQYPTYNGGSFGHGYPISYLMGFVGGILSEVMLGTPVKVMFDAQQGNFYTMSNDAGYETFKVGYNDDGTITAVQSDPQYNQVTYECGVTHMEENTKIPNLLTNYVGAWVNRPQSFCCRSEQRIACAGIALTTSHVAAELGIDPTIVALKNDGGHGHDMAYLSDLKKTQGFPDRDSLQECITVAKTAIGFDSVWHKAGAKTLADGRMHGLGFVWDHEWTDMTFTAQALIIMTGGSAEIVGHQADVGVNGASAYCQLVAEEIGLNYSDVYFKANSEGHGINLANPASASNMCDNGWALKDASQQLKAQILYMAINGPVQDYYETYETPTVPVIKPLFPGKTADELDIKGGYVFEKANPSNKQTVANVTSASGGFMSFQAPLTAWGWYSAGNWGCDTPYRERMTRQAHFVEVAVDTETGEIEVTKVVNVNDVGKAVSPESVAGQQYGGTIMGISRGKYEESIYDLSTGVKLNANLLDYKTSTIEDCGPIDTHIVETALGYGPYGLVGVGEECADLLPAAIGPAVQNAIGVWIDDYPITPAKVLKALGKA